MNKALVKYSYNNGLFVLDRECLILDLSKRALVWTIINFWVAVVMLAICRSPLTPLPPVFCQALMALAVALAIAITAIIPLLLLRIRILLLVQADCHRARRINAEKWSEMDRICGVQCVPFVDINCSCP